MSQITVFNQQNKVIETSDLIYNKSATARIFKVNVCEIIDLRVWSKICFVIIRGRRPTFISKKVFLSHFADWRLGASQRFQIVRVNNSVYRVIRPLTQRVETITITSNSINCTCPDYQTQQTVFGQNKACCSHVYRTLNYLGYERLKDYLSCPKRSHRNSDKPNIQVDCTSLK